mgnify:CR=1 FL=1
MLENYSDISRAWLLMALKCVALLITMVGCTFVLELPPPPSHPSSASSPPSSPSPRLTVSAHA